MRSLKEEYLPLEDKKSATFFKVTDVISKLGGSPLVQYSSLIYFDELEAEVSKLKHKWDREFDSLTNFSMEIIKAQAVDYVDLNNNISIIVNEAQEEIMEIENKIFEMKIKHEIIVPRLRDFITKWLEKQLVAVSKTN